MLCHVMSTTTTTTIFILHYFILCHAMPYHAVLCHEMLCNVMICHVMSRCIMSCRAMECYVSCHVMHDQHVFISLFINTPIDLFVELVLDPGIELCFIYILQLQKKTTSSSGNILIAKSLAEEWPFV